MTRQAPVIALLAAVLAATPAHAAPAEPATDGVPGSGPCASDTWQHESLIPKDLDIPVPYPVITTVPYPAPEPETVRIDPPPLPVDPCADPCPDLTDEPVTPDPVFPRIALKPSPFHLGIPVPGEGAEPLPPLPAPETPPIEPAPQAPALPAPRVVEVSTVAKQTGAGSVTRTDKRWQVYGTDLGIMWESEPGRIAVAFGDTVGRGFHPPGGQGDDWRSNVLAFSTDRDLADGMSFDSMVQDSRCHAAEILGSRKLDNVEITTIPTSGFAVGDRQYLTYMSIRTWNSIPGTWWTNHGGIAYSDDGGSTWTKDPYAKWDNIFGVTNFQVAAAVPAHGYVYLFGTPNTRLGSVALARVPEDRVLEPGAYQYWRDGNWTPAGGYTAATPVVHGPAGELSVRYDAAADRWQMTYLDTAKAAIVVREAESPQGVWSESTRLVGVEQHPELYGGFLHPWSTDEDLYFMLSTWSDYNTFLLRARIER
ncbi:DUF4185 domain-containing protein [Rhodococcus aetherivorans]|uniref:DUF4185 domain-containing protein n=1 Tax=Rhodococcus aetherivorans TaxID=191292 RepID=UPI003697A499